jgi:hypothetical protein
MIKPCQFKTVDRKMTRDRFEVGGHGIHQYDMGLLYIQSPDAVEVSTETVVNGMRDNHVRPAVLEELLALAALTPRVRLAMRVFALGSVWRDEKGMMYVPHGNLSRTRRLDLMPIRREPRWSSLFECFACIRQ